MDIQGPLILTGDFNCILLSSESGGSGSRHPDSLDFLQCPPPGDFNCIFLFSGVSFTLSRGSRAATMVSKRLDRAFVNLKGRSLWPNVIVKHLAKFSSDHTPILFCNEPSPSLDRNRRSFRFEACWLKNSGIPAQRSKTLE
ncbi:hypothetical protein V2J09_021747 [Rumex salicifolius]